MFTKYTPHKKAVKPYCWLCIAIACTLILWRSVGIHSPIVWAMAGADALAFIFILSVERMDRAEGGQDA